MSKARYLIQWFPSIIEEELPQVNIKRLMGEQEREQLKDELGIMMFGNEYNPFLGNAEMPSRMAGQLGSKVKEWKGVLEEDLNPVKKQSY